ncbi:guanine nucleotide exchange factor 10-like protein [Desmophyllum pertusum]|uniref:Guanine nucleotide exchange factor 10-like protein n=1 Tax=Desmophyllum pertusum TaxID=174260 RepID=A0A9X0A7N9_9CNID|nr:guanine nucleotide exchange factor 10-like protein [Desmophyllum pertusum]
MPLLKDNSSLFVLNQKAKVHCIVVESFHVCDSIVICGAYVERTCGEEKKFKGPITGRFGFPFPTVWLGTQGGRIFIYNAVDSTRRYVMSVKLPDAVLDIKAVNMKIYAGVADGSVVIFKRNQEGTWNFSEPKAVGLGKFPVMAMAVVRENLWCSCGNKLFIINHAEEVIKHVIEVDDNPKTSIKHLVSYGVGVWVSVWKFPSIKLFHSETLKHVQDISISSPVTNMQRDIDSQLEKTKLDQVYATALAADEGLLWVGTSVGVTLVFPLPRLEGIPLVSGKACVAFHSYCSSVRCFYPLKNNPNAGTGHGPEAKKMELSLFREHEVRDACVQTDAGVSGAWSYASRGAAFPNSKMQVTRRQTTDRGEEDEEDFSDEDVHSDDEFNFIEDKQQTLNGMRIASVGTASSTGSFSVRFEDPAKSPTPSSVLSDDFVGKTDFQVDDFARMLSEFKGFGSTPPSSIPEAPRIPLVVVNEQSTTASSVDAKGDGPQETGEESAVSGETTGSSSALGEQGGGSGNETADCRGRIKSVGEYVKLNDARAAAEAQGISLEPVNENTSASKDHPKAKATFNRKLNPNRKISSLLPVTWELQVTSRLLTTRIIKLENHRKLQRRRK